MAKSIVKCPYCGLSFDRNDPSIEWVKPNPRRYAHKSCYENHQKTMTQEERDIEEFYQYTKKLFGSDYNYMSTKKLAERYVKENKYSYSGMTKALKWFYEIQHHTTENANGTIGIIPYIWENAYQYYFRIFQAQQANLGKKDYKIKTEEITIESPQPRYKEIQLWFEGEQK